jgi:hypothetical protein
MNEIQVEDKIYIIKGTRAKSCRVAVEQHTGKKASGNAEFIKFDQYGVIYAVAVEDIIYYVNARSI